jgi:hypothetical protein
MSNVSFPASHLSAFDIGKRLQVITTEGAKITDKLVQLTTKQCRNGQVFLYLYFENTLSTRSVTHPGNESGFMVDLNQFVKRVGE